MTAILNAIRKHLGGVIFSLILSLAALRGIQVMSAQPQPPKVASPYLSYGRFYLERSIPAAKPSYYSESEWQKKSDDDRKTYWRCDYPVFSGGKAAAVIRQSKDASCGVNRDRIVRTVELWAGLSLANCTRENRFWVAPSMVRVSQCERGCQ